MGFCLGWFSVGVVYSGYIVKHRQRSAQSMSRKRLRTRGILFGSSRKRRLVRAFLVGYRGPGSGQFVVLAGFQWALVLLSLGPPAAKYTLKEFCTV